MPKIEPPDVVLVVVGDEGADHLHAVGFGPVEQRVHAPGRIHEERLSASSGSRSR